LGRLKTRNGGVEKVQTCEEEEEEEEEGHHFVE
jgi:hypothetical protein